jgi:ATP-binding cassette subfamily F protein uup
VLEDFLDGWPGTLVAVSHDRYFLERVCDEVWALLGDGTLRMLPRGVEEYLEHRRHTDSAGEGSESERRTTSAAQERQARKDIARIERRLAKLGETEAGLHAEMAENATDHEALASLDKRLRGVVAEKESLEEEWLTAAEVAEG